MIGIVVVTHGQLATELVNAAETIVGDLPQFAAVSIGWHEDVQDARNDIAAAIARVKGPSGVLIATDMFGGTPSNLGITFLEEDVVEIVTGVNLPMLIKAASLQGSARLTDVARSLREHGRDAIWVASDLLTGSTGAAGASGSAGSGSAGSAGSTGSAGSGSTGSEPTGSLDE
jgi:mannose PTS system EIIA component